MLDLVTINADVETNFLENALEATATGLEGRRFREPAQQGPVRPQESHCSAFAATGPATADGQVVFGHITMWNLFHAYHYNVWLDVKPARGHRVLMQTYPGGIMSGLDYYMNDRGILVCETTIAQTKFDATGIPLVDRIRRALQYGDSIDSAVTILREGNNGLYTNEWLLADTKTNEIAMFELGTHKSRLWKSSKNEWFGGTAGFYWGCNNAKDLEVRLETVPALDGRPANVVFHPSDRDRTWLELFDRKNKTIDVDFGFLAFTTPPLVGRAFARREVHHHGDGPRAQDLGEIRPAAGPYLGTDRRRAQAVHRDSPPGRQRLDDAPAPTRRPRDAAARVKPVDLARINVPSDHEPERINPPAWHGTILPESDADIWLAAAFADYERIVAREKAIKAHASGGKLGIRDRERLALALFAPTSRYLTAVARRGGHDLALSEVHSDLRSDDWYDIAVRKRRACPGRAAGDHGRQAVRQVHGRVRPRPCRPARLVRRLFRCGREGPRQTARRSQGRVVERRRPVETECRRPRSQGLGPLLVGRLVRAAARQGVDRLRNHRRGRFSARGRRTPCSASWPAAGPISPFPSRPTTM